MPLRGLVMCKGTTNCDAVVQLPGVDMGTLLLRELNVSPEENVEVIERSESAVHRHHTIDDANPSAITNQNVITRTNLGCTDANRNLRSHECLSCVSQPSDEVVKGAAVEDQGSAVFVHRQLEHFAENQPVVTSLVPFVHPTVDPCGNAIE